jgi:hypothetical protein
VEQPTVVHPGLIDHRFGLNDPATGYEDANGDYVVINDVTGDVVQVSDKNAVNWLKPWDLPQP